MQLISLLFILLLTFGIGLPLAVVILDDYDIGIFGLSFLLGLGIFTLVMYISNLLGIKFTFINNIILLLLVSLPLLVVARKNISRFFHDYFNSIKQTKINSFEKPIIVLVIFFVATSIISDLYWPVYSWDALALYDYRGISFSNTGFMSEAINSGYFWGYPLLTSLAHTIVYLSGDSNPHFIYTLFYISLAVCFYGAIRRFTSRGVSLIATLSLITIPDIFDHSLFAYTNLPYTAYFSIGVIYAFIWQKTKNTKYMLISALLIGLSTWVRSKETFWLLIVLAIFLESLFNKKIKDAIYFLLIFIPIQQMWKIFQSFGVGSKYSTTSEISTYSMMFFNLFDFNKWQMVITYLYKNILLPWGPSVIAFSVSFLMVVYTKKFKSYYFIFLVNIALILFVFVGTYFLSLTYPYWASIGGSATRMSMFFYPLFIFATGLAI